MPVAPYSHNTQSCIQIGLQLRSSTMSSSAATFAGELLKTSLTLEHVTTPGSRQEFETERERPRSSLSDTWAGGSRCEGRPGRQFGKAAKRGAFCSVSLKPGR